MTTNRPFQRALLNWYRQNGRSLPWRTTRNPYAVLVSEIMLQQTQVVTVLPYYKNWLRRFPTFAALARASESDVLHAWQGLGYYTRARNFHAAAKLVMNQHRGRFPRDLGQIEKLPGIGKYTAHAIGTFAFDQSVPIVEANVSRVLSRVFNSRIPIDSTEGRRVLWDHAGRLVPAKSPARYNSALLDLGALICLPRNPKCHVCPVKRFCRAKNPESLPIKRARPAVKELTENHALIIREDKILLEKSADRWLGMWILPPLNRHWKDDAIIYETVFPFTNHRVTLRIFRRRRRKIEDRREPWFSIRDLDSIPIPSPHRRAITALLN